jgi:hypothetical protein
MPHICDYEGSDYKTRFWQNANRAYEDAVERVAMRRLLPPAGKRIAEFGAGFGRLADLYAGYDEVILVDYSRTLLQEAMQTWGGDPRFKFVAANLYALPFAPGALSAASMIRVIHAGRITRLLSALGNGATFVMEFANKRNLKAMARYAIRKQNWSPYAPEPVEFVKLNFDFHPAWMKDQLSRAGFEVKQTLPVSYLRAGFARRALPLGTMVKLDSALQNTGALYAPSVFTQNRRMGGAAQIPIGGEIFVSPRSGKPLRREGDLMVCDADGTKWRVNGAFYDFKEEV